jgi:threonylcarbamoyladenosine tRNA methylthiotransferase MtaB
MPECCCAATRPSVAFLRYHASVPTFSVENFGCRATQADGAALEGQFRERGMARADSSAAAQVVVLNTCTVTASADRDARAAIRRIHHQNPACEIVVTGCYAQRAPEEIAALPGVSRVIGNSHKHQLVEIVSASRLGSPLPSRAWPVQAEEGMSSPAQTPSPAFIPLSSLTPTTYQPPVAPSTHRAEIFISDIFAHTELLAAPVFHDAGASRIRPNLKVQDGCDNRCSFCVIPSVRGQSRSLPLDRILHEVNTLVAADYREVVISGINLGRWGRDLPAWRQPSAGRPVRPGIEALIESILSETTLEKLRLSSIEPMDWSDELISLMADSPRIAKHAHVPMQSGSDRVLRRMHRKYRPWHYREKIEKIRAAVPTAAIGADVMTGFPGETDADFEETRRLIDDLPFTYLHVFTYSSRPGTPSATMPNQVPVQVARERNRILRELADRKKNSFMQSFVGKKLDAITLNASDDFNTEALTDNYLKLRLNGDYKTNRWLSAEIQEVVNGTLVGSKILM